MAFGEEAEQRWGAAILGSLALVAAFALPWLIFSQLSVEEGSMVRHLAAQAQDEYKLGPPSDWMLSFAPLKVFLLTGIGFYCHACFTHRYDLLRKVVWLLIFFSATNLLAAFSWRLVAASFARQWLDPTNRHVQGLFVVELMFWTRALVFDWVFLTLTLLAWGIWMAKLTGLPRK